MILRYTSSYSSALVVAEFFDTAMYRRTPSSFIISIQPATQRIWIPRRSSDAPFHRSLKGLMQSSLCWNPAREPRASIPGLSCIPTVLSKTLGILCNCGMMRSIVLSRKWRLIDASLVISWMQKGRSTRCSTVMGWGGTRGCRCTENLVCFWYRDSVNSVDVQINAKMYSWKKISFLSLLTTPDTCHGTTRSTTQSLLQRSTERGPHQRTRCETTNGKVSDFSVILIIYTTIHYYFGWD